MVVHFVMNRILKYAISWYQDTLDTFEMMEADTDFANAIQDDDEMQRDYREARENVENVREYSTKIAMFKRRNTSHLSCMLFFTSLLADLNIFVDWYFYADIKDEGAVSHSSKVCVLAASVLGSWTWLNFAFHALPAFALSCVLPERYQTEALADWINALLSSWWLLAWEVLFSDGPMLYLSIAIDTERNEGKLSSCGETGVLALANIVTSLLDIMMKLIEAFDNYRDFKQETA